MERDIEGTGEEERRPNVAPTEPRRKTLIRG